MADILRMEHVSKSYQNGEGIIEALKDVSLSLKKEELLAIMGSSGSGKSTLLHILGALDTPEKGTIYLNHLYEKNYSKEPYATKIRSENIGFVFQQFNLIQDLTVEENITLPLVLKGESDDLIHRKLDEVLLLVGLSNRRYHRPFELSGGQKQRVAIARAIITEPKILLADEPTGNLDYNTTIEIMNLLKKMNKERKQSIIVVTHDPEVAAYADRVLFFHNGLLVEEYNGEPSVDNIIRIFRSLLGGKEENNI
jgi:putative ABC transport system ATP-binding protein